MRVWRGVREPDIVGHPKRNCIPGPFDALVENERIAWKKIAQCQELEMRTLLESAKEFGNFFNVQMQATSPRSMTDVGIEA